MRANTRGTGHVRRSRSAAAAESAACVQRPRSSSTRARQATRNRRQRSIPRSAQYCDKDLPPASTEARICTYECTFCADCVENALHDVCPNCGGGFAARPIRPATEWRPGLSLAKRPASRQRVHLSYSHEDVAALAARLRDVPPAER